MSVEELAGQQVGNAAALQGIESRSTDSAQDRALIGNGPSGESLDLSGKLVRGESGNATLQLDYNASLRETLDEKDVTVDLGSGKFAGEGAAENYQLTLSKNDAGQIRAEIKPPEGQAFQVNAGFTEGANPDIAVELSQRVSDGLRVSANYDQSTDTVGVGASYEQGDFSASVDHTPGLNSTEVKAQVDGEKQTTTLSLSTSDGGETVDAELKSVIQAGEDTQLTLAGQSLAGQLKASGELQTKLGDVDLTLKADSEGNVSAEAKGPLGEDVDAEAAWNSDGELTVRISADLGEDTTVNAGIAEGQPELSVKQQVGNGTLSASYGGDGSGGERFEVQYNAPL